MPLANLKNTFFSGLEKAKEAFFSIEEKALESLPEPYIPTAAEIAAMPEKLRQKASEAIHGEGTNPSQLGDPISLKAEQSDNVPKPDEEGAKSSVPSSSKELHNSGSGSSSGSKGKGGETLREKATKKLNGPDANPSQLGDPISLKAEQSDHVPTPEQEGAKKRDSKL